MKGKEEMRILKNVDGDESQEGQAPRLLRDPGQPSAQEKAAHACIHIRSEHGAANVYSVAVATGNTEESRT